MKQAFFMVKADNPPELQSNGYFNTINFSEIDETHINVKKILILVKENLMSPVKKRVRFCDKRHFNNISI